MGVTEMLGIDSATVSIAIGVQSGLLVWRARRG
jgi:hypothetical protein